MEGTSKRAMGKSTRKREYGTREQVLSKQRTRSKMPLTEGEQKSKSRKEKKSKEMKKTDGSKLKGTRR